MSTQTEERTVYIVQEFEAENYNFMKVAKKSMSL